ncbi:MAG: GTP cyclohydrolase I type 1, partial [uncultured Rubrobacteraceae bacterium]
GRRPARGPRLPRLPRGGRGRAHLHGRNRRLGPRHDRLHLRRARPLRRRCGPSGRGDVRDKV